MRYPKIILVFGVVVFVLATLVTITSWAAEDVRNSKHNLSTNPNILATGTTEVCVFCHTPHGGTTDVARGAAPLWNRNLSTATYSMYSSPNFDGIGMTPGTPRGVSVACLSCHDGTVAFDSLINFGGSGSTDTITFTGDFVNDIDGSFEEIDRPAGPQPFPNLGPDLSNDHPISMEIPDATVDPQFSDIRTYVDGQSSRLTNNQVAYISRFGDAGLPTDPRDRLRAYPTELGEAYIECASCHNPHENTSTRFLRMPSWDNTDAYYVDVDSRAVNEETGETGINAERNAGSLLCLSCHQK